MIRLSTSKGFTLIEVMITVGILAIVAAVAVPAYNGYIATSRLTEGWNNLYALKAAQQQFFVENNKYFAGGDAATLKSESGNLWVRGESDATANFLYEVTGVTATGYTATATGTNKLAATVKLQCTITAGQSACVKL